MTIASRFQEYLERNGIEYELLAHPYAINSMQTAQLAHVPGDKLVKSVLLEDDSGPILALLPATHRIDMRTLDDCLKRHLELADESALPKLFSDCTLGAIPALGQPYGLEMVVEDSLCDNEDLYLETGDHVQLAHVNGDTFRSLVSEAEHIHFSYHI